MDKLELPLTKQHVAYILRNMPGIKCKMQGKPRLTALHKKKRLQFAKDHMHWIQEWQKCYLF